MIKEAKIACDPVKSLQALKSEQTCNNTERTDKFLKTDRRPSLKARSFMTDVKASPVSFASNIEKSDSV